MNFEDLVLGQKLRLCALFTNNLFKGVVKELSESKVSISWVMIGNTANYDFSTRTYSKKDFEDFKNRVSPWGETKAFEDFL